ncbi:hydrogenase maturation nickel metallochaperone HypA/HybF [Geotalea toluenoxydans]|uniref:hydrogenase maturation nickel metallochaperone HypA/HybF n=1 Tax=Geotalea toluenoxydans TaxID=421624 RepID=UPI0006CF70E1|nr:hydrogenase maturation nickel metallochaperone HypA [Geotalea toluenoxydans]
MHELSITRSVVDICMENAGGRRVCSVTIEIGALSGVAPESIRFCFDACTKGTPLENALLLIEQVAASGRCRQCNSEFPVKTCYDPCPGCGGVGMDLITGDELRVKGLTVA